MTRRAGLAFPGLAFQGLAVLGMAVLGLASTASAATLCVNPGGTAGCWATISGAVAAAAPGDTINVAAGTYAEQVTIAKPLSLVGNPFSPPVIDAHGLSNGIFVNGMAAAPLPGVANVSIYGFNVQNANYEGILVANASNVTLAGNHVHNNNKTLSAGTCPGIPAFETNEQSDCGEGVHFIAVDHSSIVRNLIEDNSGGILITNETGISSDNLVLGNDVHHNGYACGITMAAHAPATSIIPSARGPYPILHNTVSGNSSHHNGLLSPGAGAGVGIFAPFPGTTNTANVVTGNIIHDNGLPGVTMHNHASAPYPAPGVNMNDNIITANIIYGNAADTEDAFTPGSTGINVYSTAPVTGTVIEHNEFDNETIDIAFKAPGGSMNVHFNDFNSAGTGIANYGAATIDGTENWWNCATGPISGCSTPSGPGITTAPWLPFAYGSF